MMNNRLIAGAVAGVLGVVFAIAAVFLGGVLASEDSPSTNVNSFDAEDGFRRGDRRLRHPRQRRSHKLTKRGLLYAALVALFASFLQSPGLISADTKLDLTGDPTRIPRSGGTSVVVVAPLGQVQNQAYGYFFPHGAFFALGDLLSMPAWITQRLWWALLLWVGFVGFVRLADALGVGSRWSRIFAALVFVASPRVLTTIGSISSETLPMMLAPWVLAPVVMALGHVAATKTPRRLAFESACALALMGAVNAVATVAAASVAIIWWLMHTPLRAACRPLVAVRGVVAARCCDGLPLVDRAAAHPVAGQPPVPGLHRIVARDNGMGVTDRGPARHELVDTVRLPGTGGRRRARHPARRGRGHGHPGRRRPDRTRDAGDARARAPDRHPDRRSAPHLPRLPRTAGIAHRRIGSGLPRRRRCPTAQRPQMGTADPDPAHAGHRAPVGPRPDPGHRRMAWHASGVRAPRAIEAGRRCGGGAGGTTRCRFDGLDQVNGSTGQLQRHPFVLERHREVARRQRRGRKPSRTGGSGLTLCQPDLGADPR